MIRFDSPWKNAAYCLYRWIRQFLEPAQFVLAGPRYLRYASDWLRYKRMTGAERTRVIDSYPCLNDRTATTKVDYQYLFQDIWAFSRIRESGVTEHVDVGSDIKFVGLLTTICRVTFVDIRPLGMPVPNLDSRKGSVLAMPYPDAGVHSLSCLHVAEHIGLGRYGDPLDPAGTKKACAELQRILAPGGDLYFSTPVGKPRVCFNAHRIHSPAQILAFFAGLSLVDLSGVTDDGRFVRHVDPELLTQSNYACGLFHFTRKQGL